jgi:predicted small lipoprotein YifL
MKRTAQIGGIAMLALLAGCGKVGPLEPKAGNSPPAKAYGQESIPESEDLLKPSEQSRPGRSDELMRRSERRSDDPFDLPPGTDPTSDKADKGKKPAPAPAETPSPQTK